MMRVETCPVPGVLGFSVRVILPARSPMPSGWLATTPADSDPLNPGTRFGVTESPTRAAVFPDAAAASEAMSRTAGASPSLALPVEGEGV